MAFDLIPLALTAGLGGFVDNKVEMGGWEGGGLVKLPCSKFDSHACLDFTSRGASDAVEDDMSS